MNKEYETIGKIVWHNLCHTITVCRDYNNYSEGGMPYVIDHFIIHVRDSNGNLHLVQLQKLDIDPICPLENQNFMTAQLIAIKESAIKNLSRV